MVRLADVEDVNFIIDSWLRSFFERGMFAYPRESYWTYQRAKILRILAESAKNNGVKIAANSEKQGQIFGYMVGWGDTLHYMYVKAPFRQFGVSKLLRDEGFNAYTHHTDQSIFVTKNMEFEENWKCNF